jgi:inositol-phosphate phosphatase/L-galactose 1-phosphate phosphatase/histidinol-phosphatase
VTGSVSAELVALANSLADAARPIAARYFRTPVTVDDKADQSPVTIADREAETAMRTLLDNRVPQHGVFGEEHGAVRTDAEFVWVLDPIDGTKAFITGLPIFGTLIALLHRGVPVLGIIDQPISKERWVGVVGQGSTLNGRPIKVRACPGLDKAYMIATPTACWPPAMSISSSRIRSSSTTSRRSFR